MSTGMNSAVSGLTAAQMGLYVTGHNMANHNTKGYTRQYVSQAHFMHRTVGTNAMGPLQVGLGTTITGIRQIRNHFFDMRFREAAPRMAYWETKAATHSELDSIFGELEGNYRLQTSLNNLSRALNELNNDPGSRDTRGNFVSQAGTFLDRANSAAQDMLKYQMQLNEEVKGKVVRINQLITDIHELNQRIVFERTGGQIPNDFYDLRNNALDELSNIVDVTIIEMPKGSINILVAEGGHQLLVNGIIHSVGLRQSTPGSSFVEPVFTNRRDVLSFGEHAPAMFDWYRLSRNYSPENGAGRGSLLALLASRGLGSTDFSSHPVETEVDVRNKFNAWATANGIANPSAFRTDFIEYLNTHPSVRGAMPLPPTPLDTDPDAIAALEGFLLDMDLVSRRRFDINVATIPRAYAQLDTLINSMVNMFNDALTQPSDFHRANVLSRFDADYAGWMTALGPAVVAANEPALTDWKASFIDWLNLSPAERNALAPPPPPMPPVPGVLAPLFTAADVAALIANMDLPPQSAQGQRHDLANDPPNPDLRLFVEIRPGGGLTLGNIMINPLMRTAGGASHLALSYDGESDNRVTLNLLKTWDSPFIKFGSWEDAGISGFYRNLITDMATKGNEAINYLTATTEEVLFVDARRQSVTSVSLEEEMSNMIRFQHAYNASARMISTIDSMLERIVNGLGAGRG